MNHALSEAIRRGGREDYRAIAVEGGPHRVAARGRHHRLVRAPEQRIDHDGVGGIGVIDVDDHLVAHHVHPARKLSPRRVEGVEIGVPPLATPRRVAEDDVAVAVQGGVQALSERDGEGDAVGRWGVDGETVLLNPHAQFDTPRVDLRLIADRLR
ncbi:MAG: hypothetical protein R3B72_22440 [Polyangiaceae bacterium]